MPDVGNLVHAALSPSAIDGALSHWPWFLSSADALVWLFIIVFLRFHVPAFAVWIVNIVNPKAFRPEIEPHAPLPLVSVVIAGRNPGEGIRRTIRSVLDSGYPRLEVLYADDWSTNDSVAHARTFERSGLVRVFASAQHNGKPTNLNIAIFMARGELVFVLDADAEIEYGTIQRLVAYMQDPQVGAVCTSILVRNANESLITRMQQIEYAINGSIARLWRSQLGILPILPGAASMFRTDAIKALGGYDTGLGDDTDMTIRFRKKGWHIRYALDARIWTDQPSTIKTLLRQRIRWARNMVKVRVHKHADFINPRYGFSNFIVALDHWVFRVILPVYGSYAIVRGMFVYGPERPVLLTSLFGFLVFFTCCKILIANDLSGTPPLYTLLFTPFYPLYRLVLRTADTYAILRELFRIKLYHPYVPKRIWSQIPHW